MSSFEVVAAANASQLEAWDGATGAFWAEHADEFDRGVAAYRSQFMSAAAIGATSRALDIGCGTGQATRDAARLATHGWALGVDLSSQMIAIARQRAAQQQLDNVAFEQADAQVHPFAAENFDIAISRHGAMFFADPGAAFTNIGHALRPGGRLILLTWQSFDRNEFIAAVLAALTMGRDIPVPPSDAPSPFALSDPDRIRFLLSLAGFTDIQIHGVEEPMNFGPDPDAAYRYLSGQHAGVVRDLDPGSRRRALENLHASILKHHTEQGVLYGSAAWLIEAISPS